MWCNNLYEPIKLCVSVSIYIYNVGLGADANLRMIKQIVGSYSTAKLKQVGIKCSQLKDINISCPHIKTKQFTLGPS